MSDKKESEQPEFPQASELGSLDLEFPKIPGVEMPDLEVGQPKAPSLDFSLPGQPLEQLPGLEQIALDDLELDFDVERMARGRPYRPLLAIGKAEEGEVVLRMPFSVVQLQDGNLYVIDFMDQEGRARVQLFDPSGSWLRTIREFEVGDEPEALDTPAGIAADAQGNFYITDMESSCIKKFSPDGTLLDVFGSEGVADDQLMVPQDVDLDTEGNLYVADTDNNRILKWDQQGNCLLVLGINELDEDAGWLMEGEEPGEFDGPQGVTVDGAGNILIADTNNHRVQKFSPAGEFLETFGEEGEDAGEFYYPDDIQVDTNGDIFVSDSNGGRIQKFDASGHFVYQIILPSDAGSVGDFEVDDEGHIFVALRSARLVLKLEVG